MNVQLVSTLLVIVCHATIARGVSHEDQIKAGYTGPHTVAADGYSGVTRLQSLVSVRARFLMAIRSQAAATSEASNQLAKAEPAPPKAAKAAPQSKAKPKPEPKKKKKVKKPASPEKPPPKKK